MFSKLALGGLRVAVVVTHFLILSPLSAATELPFKVTPIEEQLNVDIDATYVDVGVRLNIPKDHYVFADKTTFSIEGPAELKFSDLPRPPAKTKFDAFLKRNMQIYDVPAGQSSLDLELGSRIELPTNGKAISYMLRAKLRYQGCSPTVCYLPVQETFTIRVSRAPAGSSADDKVFTWDFDEVVQRGGVWLLWALFLAFLGGIASSFTPCVYPMIPITIAVIGAKQSKSKTKSLLLGAIFALGLATTYATLGVIAASSGALLGKALQSVWVTVFIVVVLALLGTSMLGLFNFRLPYFVNQWTTKLDGKEGMVGIFLTGTITGVVAAPCVGPVILGILTFVAASGSVLLGFSLLFSFALGLSLLFVLLGVFSSVAQQMPKSGPWMERVKVIFGFLLIGTALYYLQPLMDAVPFYWLLILVFVLLAFFVRIRNLFGRVGSAIVFALMLIAASSLFFGSVLPSLNDVHEGHGHSKERVAWQTNLDDALLQAKQDSKPVLIDFYADWCAACKDLERTTFRDPQVLELAKQYVMIKLDFSRMDEKQEKLLERYRVLALPSIQFYDAAGNFLASERIDGYIDGREMTAKMQRILAMQQSD